MKSCDKGGVTSGSTAGLTWTTYTYLNGDDAVDLYGNGATAIPESNGGPDLTVTDLNSAHCSAMTIAGSGGGLVINGIDGNFSATTPGISAINVAEIFPTLNYATDEVAITIDATVSPLTTDYAGVFVVAYDSVGGFATYRVSAGILYSGGIKAYSARVEDAQQAYTASTAKTWITLHLLPGGGVRTCLDSSEPADPWAATPVKIFGADLAAIGSIRWDADTRWAVVCIGVGAMAGVASVTVRKMKIAHRSLA